MYKYKYNVCIYPALIKESSDSEEEMGDVQGLTVINLDPWISFRFQYLNLVCLRIYSSTCF